MLYEPEPSTVYESKSLGTWSSLSDVNTFFNTYTPSNNWNGLKLGNYVRINDGTYSTDWVIAGFDLEHNYTAADGTVYDNGYGICMIPKIKLGVKMKWNNTDTLTGGYKSSTIHNTLNTTVANNLKGILGDHLINRNVLLSSATDGSNANWTHISSAYEWTTAYCTLMSVGQMTGTFAQNNNKYDDGEANYKLPLFNFEGIEIELVQCWTRGIIGYSIEANNYRVHSVYNRNVSDQLVTNAYTDARPLIYLR